jgi:hypothetical protein
VKREIRPNGARRYPAIEANIPTSDHAPLEKKDGSSLQAKRPVNIQKEKKKNNKKKRGKIRKMILNGLRQVHNHVPYPHFLSHFVVVFLHFFSSLNAKLCKKSSHKSKSFAYYFYH